MYGFQFWNYMQKMLDVGNQVFLLSKQQNLFIFQRKTLLGPECGSLLVRLLSCYVRDNASRNAYNNHALLFCSN